MVNLFQCCGNTRRKLSDPTENICIPLSVLSILILLTIALKHFQFISL